MAVDYLVEVDDEEEEAFDDGEAYASEDRPPPSAPLPETGLGCLMEVEVVVLGPGRALPR
jgi:hypothetical protein